VKTLKHLHKFFIGVLAPVIVSAIFLRLSFCREIPGTLIFFALVPVCVASIRWNRLQAAAGFFLTGLLFYYLLLYWIEKQTAGGMIAIVIYCSIYFIPIGILVGPGGKNLIPISFKFFLAYIWCILEFIRSNLFVGFPWGLIGTALSKEAILIQSASLWGVFGISFFVVLINFSIASIFLYCKNKEISFIRKLRYVYIHFSLLLFLVSFIIIQGETELYKSIRQKHTSIQIGLIQPNVESDKKWDIKEKMRLISKYKRMSLGVKNADLLVWPESVLPGELLYDSKLISALVEIIEERNMPILLGSGNMSFKTKIENEVPVTREIYYNSVYLMGKDKKIKDIYNKIKLVPFGEYIPFKEYFPKMQHLTPINESYHPGNRLTLFTIEKDKNKIPFSAVICIEDIYPELFRQFVKKGARFIVNLTNDGWYSQTPCAYQHFALSIFRAVENKVPLIRCANTGVSAIISPSGDVLQIVSEGRRIDDIAGILSEEISINLDQKNTFYTKNGDVFIIFAALYILIYLFKNKINRLIRPVK